MKSSQVTISESQILSEDGQASLVTLTMCLGSSRRPFLLVRSPYPRMPSINRLGGLDLLDAGWNICVQSVRGRLGSTGRFAVDELETADGLSACKWLRERDDCDGTVVMLGISYEGWTQWLTSGHEGPSAIIPILAPTNGPSTWFHRNGIVRQAFLESWSVSLAATSSDSSACLLREARRISDGIAREYGRPPSESDVQHILPQFSEWLLGELPRPFAEVPPPFVALAGWFDVFVEDLISRIEWFAASKANGVVIIGPWSHDSFMHEVSGELFNGLDAGATRYRWLNMALSWSILGSASPTGLRVIVYVVRSNRWVELVNSSLTSANQLRVPIDAVSISRPSRSSLDGLVVRDLDPVRANSGPRPSLRVLGDHASIYVQGWSESFREGFEVVGEVLVRPPLCQPPPEATEVYIALLIADSSGTEFIYLDTVVAPEATDWHQISLGHIALGFRPGDRVGVVFSSDARPSYSGLGQLHIDDDWLCEFRNEPGEIRMEVLLPACDPCLLRPYSAGWAGEGLFREK